MILTHSGTRFPITVPLIVNLLPYFAVFALSHSSAVQWQTKECSSHADCVLVTTCSTRQTLYNHSQSAVNTKYYKLYTEHFILSNIHWHSQSQCTPLNLCKFKLQITHVHKTASHFVQCMCGNWSSATECDHILPTCPQIINKLSLCTGIKLKQCNRMWPLPAKMSTNYQLDVTYEKRFKIPVWKHIKWTKMYCVINFLCFLGRRFFQVRNVFNGQWVCESYGKILIQNYCNILGMETSQTWLSLVLFTTC